MARLRTVTVHLYINNYLKPATGQTVDRLLFAVFAVLFLLRIVLVKEPRWRPVALEKAMMLCLGVVLVSMISAMPQRPPDEVRADVILYIQGLLMPYLAFFIARHMTWTDRLIRCLFATMMICGVYLAICAALQIFAHATFFMPNYLEWDGKPMAVSHLGGRQGRASASFINAVEFGCVLITIAAITMFCFVRSRSVELRVLLTLILGLLSLGIVLSMERTVWLGAVVIPVCAYLGDRPARPLVGGMAAVAALVVLPLAGTELLDSLTARSQELYPIYDRIVGAATAVNIIMHNPLRGIGFGQYAFQYARYEYAATYGDVPVSFLSEIAVPHNQYLFIFLMTGVIGFIPYILVLLRSVGLLLAAHKQPPGSLPRGLAPYLMGTLGAIALSGLFADLMTFVYLLILHYFLLGVIASRMGEAVP